MTPQDAQRRLALPAWQHYRDVVMKGWPRRQLRRREFLAGHEAGFEQGLIIGTEREKGRTREHVIPANFTLYELLQQMEDAPWLVKQLDAEIPHTMERLREFLKNG